MRTEIPSLVSAQLLWHFVLNFKPIDESCYFVLMMSSLPEGRSIGFYATRG